MKGKSIVIVEPDECCRTLIQLYLKEFSEYKTYFFPHAYQAWEQVDWSDCGLLITSVWSPMFSGIELIEKVKEKGYSLTIVATLTFDSQAVNDKLSAIEADHVLVKPFARTEFVEVISTVLCSKIT